MESYKKSKSIKSTTSSQKSKLGAPNLDSNDYWTVSTGVANRTFTCRECKKTINKG